MELDPDLFSLDRLDALFRKAPGNLRTAFEADTGRERPAGARRVVQLESSTLERDLADRPLHIRFEDLDQWATEYRGARVKPGRFLDFEVRHSSAWLQRHLASASARRVFRSNTRLNHFWR